MKISILIIICCVLPSCLKDVEPLVKNDALAELDDINGQWFKFHGEEKEYHVLYPDYYKLTLTFEITDSYLLNNEFVIGVKIDDVNTLYNYPAQWTRTGGKTYFAITLGNLHKEKIQRCFRAYFTVSGGSEIYGQTEIDYCIVI